MLCLRVDFVHRQAQAWIKELGKKVAAQMELESEILHTKGFITE